MIRIRSWNPVNDSSPGYRTVDPKRLVLARKYRREGTDGPLRAGCPCGCMDFPEGPNATFRMGHDARLRGKLIRAHLAGVEIRGRVVGGSSDEDQIFTAVEVAGQFGWTQYLLDAEKKREEANRGVLAKAMNDDRLVKVARWAPTGQVCAVYRLASGGEEVEYVTRMGDVVRQRIEEEV